MPECAKSVAQLLNGLASLRIRPNSTLACSRMLDRASDRGYNYNMQNIKAALVGGLLGILSTLGGIRLAHADCDYPSVDHEAYELAFSLAEANCDYASQGWIEDELVSEEDAGRMYDACMRLSVPPMVLSPAQHYDVNDGAFWKVGQ